jgi:hypothetical protein
MGGVASVIAARLLIVYFLDHPYGRSRASGRHSARKLFERGPPLARRKGASRLGSA